MTETLKRRPDATPESSEASTERRPIPAPDSAEGLVACGRRVRCPECADGKVPVWHPCPECGGSTSSVVALSWDIGRLGL